MEKSAEAYRTISEVAEAMKLPQHVLRFWETRFPQIKPLKRGGGRRFYRREDIDLLQRIRALLYEQGYTIKGVQNLFKELGARNVVAGQGADHPELADVLTRAIVAPTAAAPPLELDLGELPAPGVRSAAPSARTFGFGPGEIAALRDALEHLAEGSRLLAQARAI